MSDALHHLLETSARRHPERPVFRTRTSCVTYADLYVRAGAFAAALRGAGVHAGDRVAVAIDGDADYLVAFYGALMAGAAAVPLCPDTRTEPLVYALNRARALVLDADNLRWLAGQGARLPELRAVFVRGEPSATGDGFALLPYADAVTHAHPLFDAGAADAALAAVIYTSGTTGRPKGVMLSHTNLVANVRSIVSYLELTAADTVGMVLPFYYVYGNSVLHTHVAVGATIAQVGSLTFVAQVVDNLVQLACTGLSGVPATFARLLSFKSLEKADLSRLRYVTQAGAAMAPALVARLREALPHTRVFVMYGQTEASARLAYLPPERLADKPGSAGRAIPGVTLAICDAEGREVPRGEVGEVVAKGPNVMLGYLDDPEATARVLRPEGLRTGDIGRMDDEGYLYLQGRESELIKSGGHRISPYEIEAAIAGVESVHEVAVVGIADELLGEAIVAYLTVHPGQQVTKRQVLDACFLRLPKFKMPAQLYQVDELPRGATGKLQRRELIGWHAAGRGTKLK